jgi:hypothetical protein
MTNKISPAASQPPSRNPTAPERRRKAHDMSVETSNRLTDLAARIANCQTRAKTASVEAAAEYLEAGHLLIEAKAECKHGEWLPFLERAGVHERQARRLMQLARSGLKADTVSEICVKAALEYLARRKKPGPEDEIWEWAEHQVSGPFSSYDLEMEHRWFASKMMRLSGVPFLTAFCVSMSDEYALDMARLIPGDDLKLAFSIMASVAKGERDLPVEASLSVNAMLQLATFSKLHAQRIAVLLYDEASHRSKIDQARYDSEWADIHGRFMAKVDKHMAKLEAAM